MRGSRNTSCEDDVAVAGASGWVAGGEDEPVVAQHPDFGWFDDCVVFDEVACVAELDVVSGPELW